MSEVVEVLEVVVIPKGKRGRKKIYLTEEERKAAKRKQNYESAQRKFNVLLQEVIELRKEKAKFDEMKRFLKEICHEEKNN